ncbi:MAG: Hsp20/alpha crystallin family protein [Gammaproteobacteria bacterium]|nr:Hsp20/alpha crystallin family protein [Gammaproteobacteria bacterium]
MRQALFPRDLFAEFDRLQRSMQEAFERSPAIRGAGRGGFPAINIGVSPHSVEVVALVPGLAPEAIELHLEKGVLTLSGERPAVAAEHNENLHTQERFSGAFRRVINLPDDIDPEQVSARCRDGVLHVSIQRRTEAQPRRIQIS